MRKDIGTTTSGQAMETYREATRDRFIADFDITQIEALNITVGGTPENPKGTLLTFELLKEMPEDRRNSLLRLIQNAFAVNFGIPEGVTWESGIPNSRSIFDTNLMD